MCQAGDSFEDCGNYLQRDICIRHMNLEKTYNENTCLMEGAMGICGKWNLQNAEEFYQESEHAC